MNATTGAQLWNYKTGDAVVSSPAVANGIVYVGSYDHIVYAIGDYSPSPQTYQVSFVASGLPEETSWTVTFNDQTKSSSSYTINFEVQSGDYSFSVVAPADYMASLSSGTVTVNSNINQQIMFSSVVQDSWWILVSLLLVVLFLVAIALLVLYRRKH